MRKNIRISITVQNESRSYFYKWVSLKLTWRSEVQSAALRYGFLTSLCLKRYIYWLENAQ